MESRWNWFDLIIVIFCLPIPGLLEGLNPSFLRLMRLARITKLFNKVCLFVTVSFVSPARQAAPNEPY